MIRLNNTPNEGSTVKVNLGFRDSAGQYYIPAKIQYTLLALNNDKESWSVVDDKYLVPITPASSVILTIPDIKLVTGTTLSRKVMIYWDAFVDGEYSSFTDEITFDVAPKPYVPDAPVNPPVPTEVYVQVSSVSLQIGTLSAAPVMPVFIMKTNLPVNIENAVCNIKGGDLIAPCNIEVDSTGGTLTINTDLALNYLTSYELDLEGLVSTINGYLMKEPFKLSFVTGREDTPPYIPIIQENKEVYIDREGKYDFEPDEGYDAIRTFSVDVDIPVQDKKRMTLTSNGRFEVDPDAEYVAMKRAVIDVDVPGGGKPEQEKEVSITSNGVTVIEPDEGKALRLVTVVTDVPSGGKPEQNKSITVTENGNVEVLPDDGYTLGKVDVDVAVPLPNIEPVKIENIASNGTVNITPSMGYDAIYGATVHVNVPSGHKEEQEKSVTITENGTSSVLPDEGKVLSKVDIDVAIPIETGKTETITENGTVTITPSSGNTAMEDVEVTVAVPLESNKEETLTSNGVHEVVPTAGNTAMEKATVTVAVPLETGKTETITENGTTTILPSSGNAGMEDVEVTVAIPLEENKTETLTSNGEHEIVPASGNTAMKKATVTVAVPIESNRTETIEHNGTVTISPASGYAGLEDVDVTVAVPLESNKAVTLTSNGEHEVTPTAGNDGMQKATVTVAVPIESGKTETISHNGTTTISPSTGYDGLEDVEVTVAVPLEDNKQETINLEDYSAPVEVTPSTGNDGMEKVTVTLTNMTRLYVWKDPNANPNPHYMYTTYSDTSKSDGHAYQCGTTKNALLTMKNVEVNGDALYVSGYSSSLYYRDPGNDMQF